MPNRRSLPEKITYYLITGILALAFLLPMVWTLIASIQPSPGSNQTDGYGFGNFVTLAHYGNGLGTYLKNSVILTVVAVVATLFVSATGGYAFARFRFRGKNKLFILVLSVMMVPYAALLIPLIVWMKTLHLQNSLVGVGLIIMLFQLPFGVFMMRNAFAAVPRELEEAALIDGCSGIGAFRRILLPAVRPSLVTVGLFSLLAAWNDFMVSLYLLSMNKAPLPLAMVNMRQQTMGVIDYGLTTAGVVVLTLPAALLFLALQKYYVKGFTSGAVKG